LGRSHRRRRQPAGGALGLRLKWELQLEREGFSIDQAILKKRELPAWYLDEPEIPEGTEFFLSAFRDLSTCRGMDGPIPWTAAHLYAEFKGLDRDVAELLWEVVQTLDGTERKWFHDNPAPSLKRNPDPAAPQAAQQGDEER
jgi:hypothetical protein